jgi:hypothetical protein
MSRIDHPEVMVVGVVETTAFPALSTPTQSEVLGQEMLVTTLAAEAEAAKIPQATTAARRSVRSLAFMGVRTTDRP